MDLKDCTFGPPDDQLNLMQLLLILTLTSSWAGDHIGQHNTPQNGPPQRVLVLTEKPSLRTHGQQLKNLLLIESLFSQTTELLKKSGKDPLLSNVDDLWKLNANNMNTWLEEMRRSQAFQRGEMEDAEVFKQVLSAVRLSLMRARAQSMLGKWEQLRQDLSPWLLFAADVTYDEASLVSMQLGHQIRSLILDDLDSYEKYKAPSFPTGELQNWLSWISSIRSSWPVDRVVLTEAKKVLGDRSMYTAQQMAMLLQKNSYQTASEALHAARGPKTLELKSLEKIWKAEDIQSMRTEAHRLSALRIRWARDVYVQRLGQEPRRIEDLVEQHLLNSVPIDYATGKPFSLAEAALH